MASLTRVKNELSRYVEYVRRGEVVRILVRGVPVADLVPIAGVDEGADEPRLRELERRGVIRRGRGTWPRELDSPGPRVEGNDAVSALIAERRTR
jgi:prevent-host-death family protein